tara:strand:+ start:642 stop:1043 length:402 start_codon:yes stop_codon:yes gene_type:complete
MIKRQQASDKIAGSLSLACALHCLFMPSFLIVTSGFLSASIDNELVHLVILLLAVPVSIYALARGLKNHKEFLIFVLGIVGLSVLGIGYYLGEAVLGETYEKAVTVLGSMLVVFAHYRNHQACIALECDSCHD